MRYVVHVGGDEIDLSVDRTDDGVAVTLGDRVEVADLVRMIDTVLEAHGTDEVLLYAKPDSLRRGVNVMVILPRRKFSGEVRRNIQAALVESYDGQLLNYYLTMGEGEQARLHFYLAAGGHPILA